MSRFGVCATSSLDCRRRIDVRQPSEWCGRSKSKIVAENLLAIFKHAAGNPPATASLEGHIRGVWRLASVTPSPLLYCSGEAVEGFFFSFLVIV